MNPEHFAQLVRKRRTHMRVDRNRPIDDTTVTALCELATWAPNHKRTWPWRFAAFRGDGRARLGEAFEADQRSANIGDIEKWTKTRTKYLRAPNIIVVGCAAHDHETFHAENRDAVAAGVQNLLLAATSRGIASFWSTAPVMSGSRSLELCQFAPDDRVIAVVYLGYPTGSVETPERPPPEISFIT